MICDMLALLYSKFIYLFIYTVYLFIKVFHYLEIVHYLEFCSKILKIIPYKKYSQERASPPTMYYV